MWNLTASIYGSNSSIENLYEHKKPAIQVKSRKTLIMEINQ